MVSNVMVRCIYGCSMLIKAILHLVTSLWYRYYYTYRELLQSYECIYGINTSKINDWSTCYVSRLDINDKPLSRI